MREPVSPHLVCVDRALVGTDWIRPATIYYLWLVSVAGITPALGACAVSHEFGIECLAQLLQSFVYGVRYAPVASSAKYFGVFHNG